MVVMLGRLGEPAGRGVALESAIGASRPGTQAAAHNGHYAQRRADRLGRAGGATVTCSASRSATWPVQSIRTRTNSAQPSTSR
jgi:hypothetical protein